MRKNALNILLLLAGTLIILWFKRPLIIFFSSYLENDLNLRFTIAFFLRIVIIIFALVFMNKLELVRFNGLKKGSKIYNLQAIIFPLAIILMGAFSNYVTYVNTNGLTLFLFLISVLAVGLSEEVIFRGLVFPILLRSFRDHRNALFLSVFISSLLFGSLHYINLFSQPTNFSGITSQVIFAFFIGVFFTGLMLRTSSIIVPSLMHGLINLAFGTKSLKDEAINQIVKPVEQGLDWNMIIPTTIFFGFILFGGIFMIRKSEINDVLKKLN